MEMNSTAALDSLASNGIINFDADAYVKGTTPRYAGNPSMGTYLPGEAPFFNPFSPNGFGSGVQMRGQPSFDAFISHKKEGQHFFNLSPKTVITGAIAGALALFGFSKIKGAKGGLKGLWAKAKGGVEKVINGSPKEVQEAAGKAKGLGAKAKNLVSRLPGWAKGVAIVALGLFGANAIYKKLGGHNQAPQGHE